MRHYLNMYIIGNNQLIWDPPDDVYSIFCLIILIKKYRNSYKTIFTNEDLNTFDILYHYENRKIYNYYIEQINQHINSRYNELHIKINKKKEAYILYILSKIYNYKYIINHQYRDKELIRTSQLLKRFYYPKTLVLIKN